MPLILLYAQFLLSDFEFNIFPKALPDPNEYVKNTKEEKREQVL